MKGDVILSLEPKTWALSPLDQFPYLYNLKRHLLLVAYFLRRTLVPCNFAPARHLDAPDPGAEAAPTPETQVPVACSASEAARLELPVLDTHLTIPPSLFWRNSPSSSFFTTCHPHSPPPWGACVPGSSRVTSCGAVPVLVRLFGRGKPRAARHHSFLHSV